MFVGTVLFILSAAVVIGAVALVRLGMYWGASPVERAMRMPGDGWFGNGSRSRVVMTRAISLAAPAKAVWPWIEQVGRGAGWYSYDILDNGGKASARHIVSWVPAASLGDATAIGYLRHLEHGRELAWWMPGDLFLGAQARMAVSIRLRSDDKGSRLVIRMSGDAAGRAAWPAMCLFAVMDSIMACRQLMGIRKRVERCGSAGVRPAAPETGSREQYQLYEVIYATGESAGRKGRESAARWRQEALAAGVIEGPSRKEAQSSPGEI